MNAGAKGFTLKPINPRRHDPRRVGFKAGTDMGSQGAGEGRAAPSAPPDPICKTRVGLVARNSGRPIPHASLADPRRRGRRTGLAKIEICAAIGDKSISLATDRRHMIAAGDIRQEPPQPPDRSLYRLCIRGEP